MAAPASSKTCPSTLQYDRDAGGRSAASTAAAGGPSGRQRSLAGLRASPHQPSQCQVVHRRPRDGIAAESPGL